MKDGFTVVGHDDIDECEIALVSFDPFFGAESQDVSDGFLDAFIFDEKTEAEQLHDKILLMDNYYFPQFNPTVVELRDGKIIRRFQPSPL